MTTIPNTIRKLYHCFEIVFISVVNIAQLAELIPVVTGFKKKKMLKKTKMESNLTST